MADVKFEVTRGTVSTGSVGTTKDYEISGFGTPKAAIFICTNGRVDATKNATNVVQFFSMGFTDGTNRWVSGVSDANGVTTTVAERYHSDAAVCCRVTGTASGTEGLIDFDSWTANGVRLIIDEAFNAAYMLHVILIGGSDVADAFVGHVDDLGNTTSGTTVDFGVGNRFEADLVFLAMHHNSVAVPGKTNSALLSFGVGHNGASVSQKCSFIYSRDDVTTALTGSYSGTNAIAAQGGAVSFAYTLSIGNFGANGFDLTPTAGTGDDIPGFLALRFTNSPDIGLVDITLPTSGNYAQADIGFEPNFGMTSIIGGNVLADDYDLNGDFYWGLAAFDVNNAYTSTYSAKTNVSTTEVASFSSSGWKWYNTAGTLAVANASSYSFDADGWDFTLSDNPGGPIVGWGFAIGAGAVSTSIAANDLTQGQTIDNVTLTQANVLAVNSMAHGQTIDPVTLTQQSSITLQDLTQGQTIDNAALTQASIVSVDSLGQGQTIDNATLTQAGAIALNSIEQSQTIDQITLTQAHVLVAADMTQAQAIDEITLLASGTLSIDGVSQSQTIDNSTLTQANVLAVNSLSQAQTIDEALLTIAGVISIDGVTQAQVLDALELIQANVLAPNGVTQSQSVDNATVSAAGFTLNPDDITQSQAIDGTTLTQYHVLAVDGLTQAQAIDIALFGGLVIGSLNGQVVVYAAMGGNVYVIPDLSGTIH
jgi:hypothetical protein